MVLACFAMAILGWGFGFYGQAVYVAQSAEWRTCLGIDGYATQKS